MPKKHYVLYCDESSKRGAYFSNFYGGVVVAAHDQQAIEAALREKKDELNLHAELKWTKITENYREKYVEFMRAYFSYVASGRLKVRIMFTHNFHKPKNLSDSQLENRYFLLYYQLIKHAFGLRYCNPNRLDRVFVSILLDDMPDTKDNITSFKARLADISNSAAYVGANVLFPIDQMAEVKSHDHCILQGLDVILGSMQFRLNDMHLEKPDGEMRRGKRTIAKEKVYKEINKLIREIYPNFNIGATTGIANGMSDRWNHPYRHWRFIPKEYDIDPAFAKGKAPPKPT